MRALARFWGAEAPTTSKKSGLLSLAAATVYHAAYDGVRDSLGLVVGLPTMVGVWSNAILTILGIAVSWKGNWSKLERITETAPEAVPTAARHGVDAD